MDTLCEDSTFFRFVIKKFHDLVHNDKIEHHVILLLFIKFSTTEIFVIRYFVTYKIYVYLKLILLKSVSMYVELQRERFERLVCATCYSTHDEMLHTKT
jgi:hypothetical protein